MGTEYLPLELSGMFKLDNIVYYWKTYDKYIIANGLQFFVGHFEIIDIQASDKYLASVFAQ